MKRQLLGGAAFSLKFSYIKIEIYVSMSEFQTIFEKFHYPGINKFREILKHLGVKFSTKELQTFIEAQSINQIYNEQKNKQGHIVAFYYLDSVQMDIIDMSTFYNTNSHYKFILLIIDVFTRKLWAYTLKNKNNESVMNALEIFVEHNKPAVIISDNESSFISAKTQLFFTEHKIKHITCEPDDHKVLGIIDRVCRTIKVHIYKYMTQNNTTKYVSHLSEIVDAYNKTPHPSILNLTPSEATKQQNFRKLFELNVEKGKHNGFTAQTFRVGDFVRIRNKKKKFERAYDEKYSNVHQIADINTKYVTLDDGSTADIRRLKKVAHNDEKQTQHAVKDAQKENKIQKKIAREHLEIKNSEFLQPLKERREKKIENPIGLKKIAEIDVSNIVEGKRKR